MNYTQKSKKLNINIEIASIKKEALIKTTILTKRLMNEDFLVPLVMPFIIGEFISEDAFQKLQTISERKQQQAAEQDV